MDYACGEIKKVLERNWGCTIAQIIEKTGFSRQTVFVHLKHLMKQKQIIREEFIAKKQRGRPFYIYKNKLPELKPRSDLVSMPFSKVQSVCKSNKFNHCNRRQNQPCTTITCPLINP